MSTISLDEIRPLEPCLECGRRVDPLDPSVLHEVVGWVKRRQRGVKSSGGVNHLQFRYETGRIMCERCTKVRKETGTAQQGRFL